MKRSTALGATTVKSTACVAAFALWVSGCATTAPEAPRLNNVLGEATGQNGRACIRQHDIRGYGVLDQQILSIAGRRNHYLASVRPGCTNLDTSAGVLFSGNFYEICGQRADKLTTASNQCSISQIYEFKNRDEAFATYRAAKEARQALKKSAPDGN